MQYCPLEINPGLGASIRTRLEHTKTVLARRH